MPKRPCPVTAVDPLLPVMNVRLLGMCANLAETGCLERGVPALRCHSDEALRRTDLSLTAWASRAMLRPTDL